MAAVIMDGTALAKLVREQVAKELEAAGHPPVCLATVLVGDDGPSQRYVASSRSRRPPSACSPATSTCRPTATPGRGRGGGRRAGRRPRRARHPRAAPLPGGLDPDPVIDLIPPEKDVDGLTDRSLGRLVRGQPGLVPCTPLGRHAAARALRRADQRATRRRDRPVDARRPAGGAAPGAARAPTPPSPSPTPAPPTWPACAARPTSWSPPSGVARMITADIVKPGAAVIDVGCRRTEAGIVGDVDFDAVSEVAGWITPDAGRHRADDHRLPAREHGRRRSPPRGAVALAPWPLAGGLRRRRAAPVASAAMDLEAVKEQAKRLSPWAHLATVGADGTPDVTPIHPCWDGDTLWMMCGTSSVKVHNITANPAVAMHWQVTESGDGLEVWGRVVPRRCRDQAPAVGRRLRLRPQRLLARWSGRLARRRLRRCAAGPGPVRRAVRHGRHRALEPMMAATMRGDADSGTSSGAPSEPKGERQRLSQLSRSVAGKVAVVTARRRAWAGPRPTCSPTRGRGSPSSISAPTGVQAVVDEITRRRRRGDGWRATSATPPPSTSSSTTSSASSAASTSWSTTPAWPCRPALTADETCSRTPGRHAGRQPHRPRAPDPRRPAAPAGERAGPDRQHRLDRGHRRDRRTCPPTPPPSTA